MMRRHDLSMQFFDRLFVIGPTEKRTKCGNIIYWCHCVCGNFAEVASNHLVNGHTRSCGCLQSEKAALHAIEQAHKNVKHGDHKKILYQIWENMNQRCLNPRARAYKWYGARGIHICDSWRSYLEFKSWSICYGYHDGLQLHRIDNDDGYHPGNCEWLSVSEHRRIHV